DRRDGLAVGPAPRGAAPHTRSRRGAGARRAHAPRSGPLSADAVQAGLPRALSDARRLPARALGGGSERRSADGRAPRRLLHRPLLGAHAADVRRWGDELDDDGRAERLHPRRATAPPDAVGSEAAGRRPDLLGRLDARLRGTLRSEDDGATIPFAALALRGGA